MQRCWCFTLVVVVMAMCRFMRSCLLTSRSLSRLGARRLPCATVTCAASRCLPSGVGQRCWRMGASASALVLTHERTRQEWRHRSDCRGMCMSVRCAEEASEEQRRERLGWLAGWAVLQSSPVGEREAALAAWLGRICCCQRGNSNVCWFGGQIIAHMPDGSGQYGSGGGWF